MPPLGPGDVLITTTDGKVDLALVADTVWLKLSDRALRRVRAELKPDNADSDGGSVGTRLANMVKSTAGKALARRVGVPVTDIEQVRYEDGAITFAYVSGKRPTISIGHDENASSVHPFSEEDAKRFVAAVQAAKKRG